ncbi:hypothetical protein D3C78_950520 [compost metagenome]
MDRRYALTVMPDPDPETVSIILDIDPHRARPGPARPGPATMRIRRRKIPSRTRNRLLDFSIPPSYHALTAARDSPFSSPCSNQAAARDWCR